MIMAQIKSSNNREQKTALQEEERMLDEGIITAALYPDMRMDEPIGVTHGLVTTDAGLIDFRFSYDIQTFPGLLQGLVMVFAEDEAFELLNGSKWSAANIEMIKGWTETDQLVLSQNQAFFSTHRFALLNIRLGKATPITLLREPRPMGSDVFFITKVDLANDVVGLNTGQEWTVYPHDHGTLRKFAEHDRILIGVNTSDSTAVERMRYILIDTASNLYVRVNPLIR